MKRTQSFLNQWSSLSRLLVTQLSLRNQADSDNFGKAITKLIEEDPTFQVESNEETGQTIIRGMGELHLEIIIDRLKREFKVEVNQGAPQVAYKETLTKNC